MASILESVGNGGPASGSLRPTKEESTAEFMKNVEQPQVNQPKTVAESKCTYLQEGGLLGSKVKMCESSYQGQAEVSSVATQCRSDVPLPSLFACLFSKKADEAIASVRKALFKEEAKEATPSAQTAVAKEDVASDKAAGQVCYQTGDTGAAGLKIRVCETKNSTPAEITVVGYRNKRSQEISPKQKAETQPQTFGRWSIQ